jgi:hypothetical protein
MPTLKPHQQHYYAQVLDFASPALDNVRQRLSDKLSVSVTDKQAIEFCVNAVQSVPPSLYKRVRIKKYMQCVKRKRYHFPIELKTKLLNLISSHHFLPDDLNIALACAIIATQEALSFNPLCTQLPPKSISLRPSCLLPSKKVKPSSLTLTTRMKTHYPNSIEPSKNTLSTPATLPLNSQLIRKGKNSPSPLVP